MIYLTYNDQASGIYKSQVVDVIIYLNKLQKTEVQLIAFIPWQNFKFNKAKIKSWYSKSTVIPIFPGIRLWQIQRWLFYFINSTKNISKIIARGPIAATIALKSKKKNQKIIYDGRGAVKAEINEFGYFQGKLARQVIEMEAKSVLHSDAQIAVSQALVNYWHKEFAYKANTHVIIPCTASKQTITKPIKDAFFNTEVPILVYAGSTSPWQSFPLLVEKLEKWLIQTEGKVLLLTKAAKEIAQLQKKFPERILQKFVAEEEVHSYLCLCDYGLLIRDNNITNQVASPVKFSEYLRAGLKVIISEQIGDFSELVVKNRLGTRLSPSEEIPSTLEKRTTTDKERVIDYFAKNLNRNCFDKQYEKLF